MTPSPPAGGPPSPARPTESESAVSDGRARSGLTRRLPVLLACQCTSDSESLSRSRPARAGPGGASDGDSVQDFKPEFKSPPGRVADSESRSGRLISPSQPEVAAGSIMTREESN